MTAAPTGPFTLHEMWDDAERIMKYQIRHGRTPQMRTRYKLHAEAVLIAWNARAALAKAEG